MKKILLMCLLLLGNVGMSASLDIAIDAIEVCKLSPTPPPTPCGKVANMLVNDGNIKEASEIYQNLCFNFDFNKENDPAYAAFFCEKASEFLKRIGNNKSANVCVMKSFLYQGDACLKANRTEFCAYVGYFLETSSQKPEVALPYYKKLCDLTGDCEPYQNLRRKLRK